MRSRCRARSTSRPKFARPPAAPIEAGAETGLRAVIAADSSFDVAQFVEGAKSAYRMILEAFWKGDEETLGWLVEDEVRGGFAEAIAERKAAGPCARQPAGRRSSGR